VLSREERVRAERILGAHERQRWALARGVLRELLGGYLGRDPHALCFASGPHGKLALLDHRADPSALAEAVFRSARPRSPKPRSPFFNMSHSESLALYALAMQVQWESTSRSRAAGLTRSRLLGVCLVLRRRGA
jgi:phosphopantetheinyl transferase